jgi:hypothetical protein
MDVDGSSLAAAALYDMKNEQLQLANSALQQHVGGERSQQIIPSDNKQQETSVSTTTDQSVATTMEGGHHFGERGRKKENVVLFYHKDNFNYRNRTGNSI